MTINRNYIRYVLEGQLFWYFLVFFKHSSVQRSLETRSDSRRLVAGKCKAVAERKLEVIEGEEEGGGHYGC